MAQIQDWLFLEYTKLVEQNIEAKEQELREATRTKERPELIALIKEERNRLIQEELYLIKHVLLASSAGEVLAAPFQD